MDINAEIMRIKNEMIECAKAKPSNKEMLNKLVDWANTLSAFNLKAAKDESALVAKVTGVRDAIAKYCCDTKDGYFVEQKRWHQALTAALAAPAAPGAFNPEYCCFCLNAEICKDFGTIPDDKDCGHRRVESEPMVPAAVVDDAFIHAGKYIDLDIIEKEVKEGNGGHRGYIYEAATVAKWKTIESIQNQVKLYRPAPKATEPVTLIEALEACAEDDATEPCPTCGGTKIVPCDDCHGKGYLESEDGYQARSCETCGGDEDDAGSGSVPCPDCAADVTEPKRISQAAIDAADAKSARIQRGKAFAELRDKALNDAPEPEPPLTSKERAEWWLETKEFDMLKTHGSASAILNTFVEALMGKHDTEVRAYIAEQEHGGDGGE